jgi:hypothetical protein
MSGTAEIIDGTASSLTINARALDPTDERFLKLCQDNRDLAFVSRLRD